ncbi:DEAD/DEAH box helicase [Mesorhizobium sp.]|uniref:DEAD/DEAH box helicase n=1 Tax=Mesorhizobium sp. TaxID=1871066 RepID=UPI0025F93EE6|nr:DEAD/DEAH box helicase [Mesorhizobium sp.]
MGPGQDLDQLVSAIDVDGIATIIGGDLVDGLASLALSEVSNTAYKALATQILRTRPEETLARKDVRAVLFGAMSNSKLDELADRLGLENRSALRGFDPGQDDSSWRRFLGFFGVDATGVAPFHAESPDEPIDVGFGLFPHQIRAANRVWQKLDGAHSRVILHMPTGAGKTRTAIHIVSRYLSTYEPGLVVWLATASELLDQAADAFKAAWPHLGNRTLDLVRYWGDYDGDILRTGDGLVIAGLQKLHALSQRDPIAPLQLGNKVRLVVVDEAHQSIAPTYANLINQLANAGSSHAVLGLTATPGRTWADIAKDELLAEFFDNTKVVLEVEGYDNPVTYLMSQGYLAKPTFRQIEYQASQELAQALSSVDGKAQELDDALAQKLILEASRNQAIIAELKRLIDTGHTRIIFFGASVRHAELISAALFMLGIDAPLVLGTTAPAVRRRAIKAFRERGKQAMVMCNFGVLTTGFDAPSTSAAVIARPTKSLVLYSQMVGRATRGPKAGGNEYCEVSTVVDVNLPGFGDVAEAFTNWEDVWDE